MEALLAAGVVLTRSTPVYDLVQEAIHRAEDRKAFAEVCARAHLATPKSKTVETLKEAETITAADSPDHAGAAVRVAAASHAESTSQGCHARPSRRTAQCQHGSGRTALAPRPAPARRGPFGDRARSQRAGGTGVA